MLKTQEKNLFLIFGTSRGLGKALYERVQEDDKNETLIINRCKTKHGKQTKELIIDLARPLTAKMIAKILTATLNRNKCNLYVINNASVLEPVKQMGNANPEEILSSFYVNSLNYMNLINSLILASSQKKIKVSVLNISSGAAASPYSGLAIYCSTKAATEMFTKCVFLEQQQKTKSVRIGAFRPGILDTKMQKTLRTSPLENFPKAKNFSAYHKSGKLSSPKEVAQIIYKNITRNIFWEKPITDISELKPIFKK